MNLTQAKNPTHAVQPHLLVVDDDALTRRTLSRVLQKAGYLVTEAANGQEALDKYLSVRPDLVLLDVVMPEIDGFSVCRQLRKRADYQSLPIVMLTGLDDPDSVDEAFHAGATDFISKPLNWTLLVQRVRYGLRARAMSQELEANRAHLAYAQRVARLGYWEYDPTSDLFRCSDEVLWILGLTGSDDTHTLGTFLSRVAESDRKFVERKVQRTIAEHGGYAFDHAMTTQAGDTIFVHHQARMEESEATGLWRLVGTLQDITERKRAEEQIEYHAYYDDLTGLPNRRLFMDRLSHANHLAEKAGRPLVVLVIGLDRLAVINESLGHAAGDQLLQSAAKRLAELSDVGYTVARIEGDVFGLLLEEVSEDSILEGVIKDILQEISRVHVCGEHELYTSASIGAAFKSKDEGTASVLMQSAAIAMHRAKESGGNQCRYFESEMNTRAQSRLATASALRKAIERDELFVYYQPQIDVRTRQVVGAEALLRWRNAESGFIPPDRFIPIAEEAGLIIDIGRWVLEKACQKIHVLRQRGFEKFRIGVNISAKQFLQSDLEKQIQDALAISAVPPANLDLEITESVALHDFEATVITLHKLREMGLSVSIDDFGTGFCSLSYLHKLPVTALKIDRAFVCDINERGERGEIAKAIVAMAHSLGLSVIAEGVETDAQYVFLASLGCNEVQGYLLERPMTEEQFDEFLATYPISK